MKKIIRIENKSIPILKLSGKVDQTNEMDNDMVQLVLQSEDGKLFNVLMNEGKPDDEIFKVGTRVSIYFIKEIKDEYILYLYNESLQLSMNCFNTKEIRNALMIQKSIDALSVQLSDFINRSIYNRFF